MSLKVSSSVFDAEKTNFLHFKPEVHAENEREEEGKVSGGEKF
jgi:hypothetical protein